MPPEEFPEIAKIILPYATRVTVTSHERGPKLYLGLFFDTGHRFCFERRMGGDGWIVKEKIFPIERKELFEIDGIWLIDAGANISWTPGSRVTTYVKSDIFNMDLD